MRLFHFEKMGCAMAFDDFPDETSFRFRAHVFYIYAQSILNLAEEIAAEGPEHLDDEDRKLFADLASQCERIFLEATKLKARVKA